MKRFFAASLALGLAATLAHIPSASAAAGLSQQQADEITQSYMYLTQDFYQRVDAQNVLNSAHASILALLKTGGVKDPKISVPRASTDDINNVRELQREADEAISQY